MIKHILLISSLLITGIASANPPDEWMDVTGAAYSRMAVNPSRMKIIDPNKKIIEMWQKATYLLAIKDIYKPGDYTLTKQQVDCINFKHKMLSLTLYSGVNLPESNSIAKPKWEDTVPNTLQAVVEKEVCDYFFPKAASSS
jgi:hypothetical protein